MTTISEKLDQKTPEILDLIRNEKPTRQELARKLNVSLSSFKKWSSRHSNLVMEAREDFNNNPSSIKSLSIKSKSKAQTLLDAHETLILGMIGEGYTNVSIIEELSKRIKDYPININNLRVWREKRQKEITEALVEHETEGRDIKEEDIFDFLDKFRGPIVVMYSAKSMHPKTIASKISRSSGVFITGRDISQYLNEIPLNDREKVIQEIKNEDEYFDPMFGVLESTLNQYKNYIESIPAPEADTYDVERKGSESILVAPLTDLHIGEIVRPQDVRGRNAYNIDIARNRIECWRDNVVSYAKKNRIKHLKIPMLGDLVNGELHHQNFDARNEEGSIVQMTLTYTWIEKLLLSMYDSFDKIEIYNVVGNHGRSPKMLKMPNFDFQNNFDWGICYLLEHRFKNFKKLSFNNSRDIYNEMPVGKKKTILMHGWQRGLTVKSKYPEIINKLMQIVPEQFDYLMIGHFHHLHVSSIGYRKKFFICGSLKGVDGFARNDRFLDGDPEHFLLNFDKDGELRESVYLNFTNLPKKKKSSRILTNEIH